MTKLSRSRVILFAVLAILVAIPAFAVDPPSRVLRLKYMSGQVSFQPGGVDDWVAATLNRPLTTADRVWTDKESRAELTLGGAALRMSSETSLTLSNVSDNTVQVELDQGVLNVRVRRLYPGEIYEIDTPNVAFTLLKAGDYRFEVDSVADTTIVVVRKGKGEGNGNGRGVEVESGELARFENGNTLMHTMARAPQSDGFDDWCRVRDKRENDYESLRYVSDDVIGYEDLDEYGSWRPVPSYGYVWYPRTVAVGWAPYRYGHWAWIDPWGWTWIDDSPWGFAPFHYGRWVYSAYGWGWCPGPRHYRPVYAPALVAWFGGPHWGVGLSSGGGYGVGWVPLGWGEPYYPYYRVSPGYVRNVNISNTHITNITYVTNNYTTIVKNNQINNVHYVNQNVPGGVTTVSSSALEHGRPVAREMVRVSDRDIASARMLRNPEVTPTRSSLFGGAENRPASIPPGNSLNRPVVSKMAPPERPDKFENRQPYIERNRGMAVDRETMSELKRSGPVGKPLAEPDKSITVTPAEAGRPENTAGRQVPRPPDRDKRVITLDGTRENQPAATAGEPSRPSKVGAAGDEVNRGPSRYVPRPPVDRGSASRQEGAPAASSSGNVNRAESPSISRPVPRPPADRNVAPEERSYPSRVDRAPASSDRKSVDAEVVTPRDVPRPPADRPVRPATEDRRPATSPVFDRGNSEQPAAPAERRPAGGTLDRRPAPDAPAVDRRSAPDNVERRSAPQPPAERRAVPEQRSSPPVERRQQNDDRKAAPSDKSERPSRTSMRYSELPRFYSARANSYGPSYYRPAASYVRSSGSSYSPGSPRTSFRAVPQGSSYSRVTSGSSNGTHRSSAPQASHSSRVR